jgi:hypothetical protein
MDHGANVSVSLQAIPNSQILRMPDARLEKWLVQAAVHIAAFD